MLPELTPETRTVGDLILPTAAAGLIIEILVAAERLDSRLSIEPFDEHPDRSPNSAQKMRKYLKYFNQLGPTSPCLFIGKLRG